MASISKRGNSFRVSWRTPNGTQRQRTCPTKSAARELRDEVDAALSLGRDWEPDGARREPTLRAVVEQYIRDVVRVHEASTATLLARQLDVWLAWAAARFPAPLHLQFLSKRMLADYYDGLEIGRHGHPRQQSTKKKLVQAVERFWIWAYDDDECSDFVPRPRRLRMPSGTTDVPVAPTWTEMDACVRAATGPIYQLAAVLRYTGLRPQQVMRLKWDDVDLERRTLRIRGELGKSRQERRGRVIPISEHLAKEIAGWGRRVGWLCESHRTGKAGRTARQRDMQRAWERAGVKEAVWLRQSHKAFRKGFQSGLKRLGADDEAVRFLVGHDLAVRGHYIDPEALPLRQAVAMIPAIETSANVVRLEGGKISPATSSVPTAR